MLEVGDFLKRASSFFSFFSIAFFFPSLILWYFAAAFCSKVKPWSSVSESEVGE
jgi:hypothetical protein